MHIGEFHPVWMQLRNLLRHSYCEAKFDCILSLADCEAVLYFTATMLWYICCC